jgi:hypothetical protein
VSVAQSPLGRWQASVDLLPWVAGHLDGSTFECFKAAVARGIARHDAFEVAEARIRAAGNRLRRGKLERQWLGAIKWVANHDGIISEDDGLHQTRAPGVDYGRVDKIVRSGCGIYDLWEQSPVRFCDDQAHTEEIIDALFPGNPWLCVGIGKYNFWTRRREILRGHLERTEFIVAQPMTGQFGVTSEGQPSEHSLENTGPRKHYITEFDFRERIRAARTLNGPNWFADGLMRELA